MACNCATNEQIKELYKRYGSDKDKNIHLSFKQRAKSALRYGGVAVAMIFITPFLFLYVLYKRFLTKDHRISLAKFFRLDKKRVIYAGQQNI